MVTQKLFSFCNKVMKTYFYNEIIIGRYIIQPIWNETISSKSSVYLAL